MKLHKGNSVTVLFSKLYNMNSELETGEAPLVKVDP